MKERLIAFTSSFILALTPARLPLAVLYSSASLRLRKLDGLAGHERGRARAAQRVVELRHGVGQEFVDLADLRVELLLQVCEEVALGGRGRGVGRVEREEESADAFDELRAPLEAEAAFGLRELIGKLLDALLLRRYTVGQLLRHVRSAEAVFDRALDEINLRLQAVERAQRQVRRCLHVAQAQLHFERRLEV